MKENLSEDMQEFTKEINNFIEDVGKYAIRYFKYSIPCDYTVEVTASKEAEDMAMIFTIKIVVDD